MDETIAAKGILPVKPGTLSKADKKKLSDAGIIVVEHEDPASLRVLSPEPAFEDLPASTMLACAMRAIADYKPGTTDGPKHLFAMQVAMAIERRYGDKDAAAPVSAGTTA